MMKILIADDDADLVALLRLTFEGHHWRVVVAQDAMQVIMLARRERPNAILLDINMPGGTGLTALKQLKTNAQLSATPVIVISARTEAALPRAVTDLGAAQFLAKPLDPEAVYRALAGAMGVPA